MSNYTKATNFTAKDTLPSGDSNKIVKGQEIDTELTAVAAAIASKADINSPTFTGTPAAPTASAGTSTTQVATTAFVGTAITNATGSFVDESRTITAGTGLSGGGDLSANRTISLANTAVTAGSYGSSSAIPVITVNAQGQLTAASTASISTVTGSLGTSGYTRLQNGLTFAWGEITMSTTGSSNNGFNGLSGSGSLPVTFTAVYQGQVSFKDSSGTFYGASVQITSLSTTSISIAGNTAYGVSNQPDVVSYFVIGTSD